jgi:hypothetical protein
MAAFLAKSIIGTPLLSAAGFAPEIQTIKMLKAVFRIRMFLGLLDPHPDP